MENRLNLKDLLNVIQQWNGFLRKRVHLIACGGTALTIIGVKDSTKDIDFIVPVRKEYDYLVKILKQLGYELSSGFALQRKQEPYRFDLYPGKRVHTTELIDDPLKKGRHTMIKEFSRVYLGVLNDYDLIVSKLFRGTSVDFDDCLGLIIAHQGLIDIKILEQHFKKMLSFHPVGHERIQGHWDSFKNKLQKEGL